MPAGTYEVSIVDANACEYVYAATVEQPLPVSGGIQSVDILCHGESTGSISIQPAGGVPAYQIFLDDNLITPPVIELPASVYSIEIVDQYNCAWDSTVMLNEPLPISISSDVLSVSCNGFSDGEIMTMVSGGVGPYIYNWNNGSQDTGINTLTAGTYTLTLTDAHNCQELESILVTEPPLPQPNLTTINPSCFGYFDGQLIISGNGLQPYQYSIDGSSYQQLDTFDLLGEGAYDLFLTDSVGCVYTYPFELVAPPQQFIQAYQDQTIKLGDEVRLHVESQLPIDSVIWIGKDSLVGEESHITVAPHESQPYTVTVISDAGCYNEDEVYITVSLQDLVYIPNAFSPNNDGKNDVFYVYSGEGVDYIKSLMIFNRWGEQVFVNKNFPPNDPFYGWDGSLFGAPLNPQVLTYFTEIVLINGEEILIHGDITLVR